MAKDLAKQYDPKDVEDRIYKFWLDGKYFHAKCDPDKKPYTIVIPPPNIWRRCCATGTSGFPERIMLLSQPRLKSLKPCVKRVSQRKISDVRAFSKEPGSGKKSSVAELSNSSRKWAPPATGTESVSQWTRAAARLLKRFSSIFTIRDLSIAASV